MKKPSASFSRASRSGSAHSGTLGRGGSVRGMAESLPKSEACPASFSARRAWTSPYVVSSPARRAARLPKASMAPAAMSASHARLFMARMSMRSRKSKSEVKGPPDLRASRTELTADEPTPRTAPSPKRIFCSGVTVNFHPDSLTSGGRTSTSSSRWGT